MKFRGLRIVLWVLLLTAFVWFPFHRAQAQTQVKGGVFEDYGVQPGARVEIPVEIRNVEGLYAVDLEIRFDPKILVIEDTNADQAGVQPALGLFLDAGMTLFNEVDNEAGVVRFVMTQANPSEPKSGDGIILVLYVRGLAVGESDLEISILELATRMGESIPVEAVDAKVTVSEDVAKGSATSIPVQDQGSLVVIPTILPTTVQPTSTSVPVVPTKSASSEKPAEEIVAVEELEENTPVNEEKETESGFSILRYWWVIAIILVLVVGAAIVLLTIKN